MSMRVLLLGSTGSIGVQALEVIADHPDQFTIVGLAAGGANPDLLRRQIAATGVSAIAVADSTIAESLGPHVLSGPHAATELVRRTSADIVLNALTGSQGLAPTLAALESGARLALANKESLIAGGSLVIKAAAPDQIIPVDSEHSALMQCLRGGLYGSDPKDIARLVLTASGGPFRGWTPQQLEHVTPAQAARHPTWSMGPMNTLNSATLVNKGLELIETHLLFEVPYSHIDVVVHPQSVVHSMVTFTDGSTLAHASPPSMKLPIALALSWPQRLSAVAPACDLSEASTWEFEPVDAQVFPAVDLARTAGTEGGCVPAIYNAANEEAVKAFWDGRISFPAIVRTIEKVLAASGGWLHEPATVEDVFAAERWARTRVRELQEV